MVRRIVVKIFMFVVICYCNEVGAFIIYLDIVCFYVENIFFMLRGYFYSCLKYII